jgi:hypothetical protein
MVREITRLRSSGPPFSQSVIYKHKYLGLLRKSNILLIFNMTQKLREKGEGVGITNPQFSLNGTLYRAYTL